MKKEGIKSIILTALVTLSLFLTWNLWTYSPNIAKKNQLKYMEDVTISNKQEIAAIVQPVQLLYHTNDNHYGSSSEKVLGTAMKMFMDWSFSDFEDLSSDFSSQGLQSFMRKSGTSELVFSDGIPLLLYKKVINIEDRELPDVEFNRIIIKPASDDSELGSVYFINTDKKAIYKFSTGVSDVQRLDEHIKTIYNTFQTFDLIELAENKSFYLPSEELKIKSYKYYIELLDEKEFRDALFEDPKLVSRVETGRGVRFTDGLSIMNVYKDIMMLNYFDPKQEEVMRIASSELLNKSIQFVNEHAGWEENYRFAEMDANQRKVTFRLYTDGLPVFNRDGMSEIIQVWTQNEIYSYDRPFFTMNFPVPTETKEVTVLSGEQAVKVLKDIKDFQVDFLEGMAIGYRMTRDETQPQLIILEPTWHYKYNGVWQPLISVVAGGVEDGLE